jgi:hypothetical protein
MLSAFREVVAADFEYTALPGERPVPLCLVAHELKSGQCFRIWKGQFGSAPPHATGPDVLFVAYYASAELGCYRALGWSMPERILDLFAEFRDRTNITKPPKNKRASGESASNGAKLIHALAYFGLDTMGASEKKEMQEAIGSDKWAGRYTQEEILAYCESDVEALKRLLPAMLPKIDLTRALLRGRYMAAASAMEYNGTPIDTSTLALLRRYWFDIQDQLIAAIDVNFGVYDGRTFKKERFERWLAANKIPWPVLESGELSTEVGIFRQQAKAYPLVSPLRELRSALSDLRLNDLAVGRDGRNRTMLSAFRARTSRNQPSNSKFISGPSVWLRGLIKPSSGYGVAYIDWRQQEIGIAAVLSGDAALQEAS